MRLALTMIVVDFSHYLIMSAVKVFKKVKIFVLRGLRDSLRKGNRLKKESFRRVMPNEDEFMALIGLAFWNTGTFSHFHFHNLERGLAKVGRSGVHSCPGENGSKSCLELCHNLDSGLKYANNSVENTVKTSCRVGRSVRESDSVGNEKSSDDHARDAPILLERGKDGLRS